MWGRDEAPARHEAKGRMFLMHDSHNARCESETVGRIPLDGGFCPKPGGTRPISAVVGKNWTPPEPFARRADPWRGEAAVGVDFSDQDEEGQRDHGSHHASGDQGVVGRDIALRVQHRLVCFSGHSGPLRQPGTDFCEADHMRRTFFCGRFAGTTRRIPGCLRSGKIRRRWLESFRRRDQGSAGQMAWTAAGWRRSSMPWSRRRVRRSAMFPAMPG
jgi:hypothetical protein